MAIVLTGSGLLIYARLGDDLAQALDQDLRLRAQDVSALVSDPSRSLALQLPSRLVERGESFAQLLDSAGRVLDSTRPIGSVALIGTVQIRAALSEPRFFNTPSVPGLDEPARLLATPVLRAGQTRVLVVGATRENRAETLRSLRTELLLVGPLALVLATGLGYLLAGAGLRAVDAMRTQAAQISADRLGERLPLPDSGDELQRLGETLNDMLDRLERAMEHERGFVAEAGHELRTPLALLRAELDYALHYAQGETELRLALQTASAETDRLVQLAGDLLLIASADQGRIQLRREPIAVGEMLESVRRRFAWRAEDEGRSIAVDAAPDLVVDADKLRLEQALGNLVDNALRHGKGDVELAARVVEHEVELSVRDGGPGFDHQFLPRAFERFSQADEGHAAAGTGLGLAIVASIASAHGGGATAANSNSGGAEVTLSLPGS